jgi:hypothetical protein
MAYGRGSMLARDLEVTVGRLRVDAMPAEFSAKGREAPQ